MLLALLLSSALTSAAGQVQPSAPDAFITRAVFAQGRLWIRTDRGAAWSLAPGEPAPRREALPGEVLDLCTGDGQVRALTRMGGTLAVHQRRGGAWVSGGRFRPGVEGGRRRGSGVLAMRCAPEGAVVVMLDRIYLVHRGGVRVLPVKPALAIPPVFATAMEDGASLLVGTNAGEWGGEVARIDLASGAVTRVEAAHGPVQALAAVAGRPGCVVSAVGLAHLGMSSGSLEELCGAEVRTLLERPLTAEGAMPGTTVAFFGVAGVGDGLVAAGLDGLYRVRPGQAIREPYPQLVDVGGLRVSFAVPGIVLVETEVNSRAAVVGRVPMLVPVTP